MLERLLRLDRRWIFLLLFVAVIIAVLVPFKLPVETSKLVRGIYDPIQALPARAPILLALDYDPAASAELDPVARAALRQMFRKDLRVIAMTHWPTGVDYVEGILEETVKEFDDLEVEAIATGARGRVNVGRRTAGDGLTWKDAYHEALRAAKEGAEVKLKGEEKPSLKVLRRTRTVEYGRDYCYLGTKAGEQILVINMGASIATAFPTDSRGSPTRSLEVMRGVESLKDVSYLLTIAAGASADWWVIYGQSKHKFPMGVACTAVMAPDMYPFVAARQITGLSGGMKGSWEYESLTETLGSATAAIPAQTVAHMVVIALVLFCNVAFVLQKRART